MIVDVDQLLRFIVRQSDIDQDRCMLLWNATLTLGGDPCQLTNWTTKPLTKPQTSGSGREHMHGQHTYGQSASNIHAKGGSHDMSVTEICDYYDSHPNITLAELSRITGRSVRDLKHILLGGDW